MALLELFERNGYRAFEQEQCRTLGQSLAESYRSAAPFPHAVLDDFVSPDLLHQVLGCFPDTGNSIAFARNQERLKFQFHPQDCIGLPARNIFAELNSQAFLTFLSEMTGLEGLIADPYYAGAGLHETQRGGHLGIHADFNWHGVMKVERRLNLLIYLNDDWEDSYGGALELWDRGMTECAVRVMPVMGRAVVFNTDLDSYHGHPDPLTCPPERARRSIATYYYTASAEPATIDRMTNFQPRPNTDDKRDWKVLMHHLAKEWMPPALQRGRRTSLFPR